MNAMQQTGAKANLVEISDSNVIGQPTIRLVDTELLNRLHEFFRVKSAFYKGANTQDVWDKPGLKGRITLYRLIMRGARGGFVRGWESLQKESDYLAQLNGMLRLAAVVLLATTAPSAFSSPNKKIYQYTEDQINQKIEEILSHCTDV